MGAEQKHPEYTMRFPDWSKVWDCYRGEDVVKSKGTQYLPATSGQVADGMPAFGEVSQINVASNRGLADYRAYKDRAQFPSYVKDAVETMLGVLHREPARIEVPERMRPLLDSMTAKGESALTLLRKINEWQLLFGRCGLLVEVPSGQGPDAMPYVVPYPATLIANWDDGERQQGVQRLELVVLDEAQYERRQDFQWDLKQNYRVLVMSEAANTLRNDQQQPAASGGQYGVAILRDGEETVDTSKLVFPQIAGRTLDRIPFVFINTNDLVTEVDEVPFLNLSNLCLSIYKQDADYKQCLHMQGQETLVVIGVEGLPAEQRTGAGARIDLPRDSDAKFIGVSADGLREMREALQRDHEFAMSMTSKLLDLGGNSYQSGEALKVRVAAKTATLMSIARTGAEGLKKALQIIAVWMGENPDEIVVEPNTEFAEATVVGRTLLELQQAKMIGAPLSNESIHRFARRNDLTEKSFEEEMAAINQEEPLVPPAGGGLDQNAQQSASGGRGGREVSTGG